MDFFFVVNTLFWIYLLSFSCSGVNGSRNNRQIDTDSNLGVYESGVTGGMILDVSILDVRSMYSYDTRLDFPLRDGETKVKAPCFQVEENAVQNLQLKPINITNSVSQSEASKFQLQYTKIYNCMASYTGIKFIHVERQYKCNVGRYPVKVIRYNSEILEVKNVQGSKGCFRAFGRSKSSDSYVVVTENSYRKNDYINGTFRMSGNVDMTIYKIEDMKNFWPVPAK